MVYPRLVQAAIMTSALLGASPALAQVGKSVTIVEE